jgi:NAD(P)H dehydrogenase (quinone)
MTDLTNILVVYTSTLGNTQKMAESIADGAQSVTETTVTLREATKATKEEVRVCDALLLGAPIRHRSADARVKQFIENTIEILWLTDDLVGKVGGVFSVGGGYGNAGAGVEIAQLGLLAAMAGAGMILVPLPKTTPGASVAGSHWGAHGRSGGLNMEPVGITDEMLQCAYHHGANVARVAATIRGKDLMARGNQAPSQELIDLFSGSSSTTS